MPNLEADEERQRILMERAARNPVLARFVARIRKPVGR